MTRIAPEVVDLTAESGRAISSAAARLQKRPASPSGEHGGLHKRAKEALAELAPGPRRLNKRALDAEERPQSAVMDRALQASELENSLKSMSGALRWRSPVKPHKLARLGEGLPGRRTAVRGIVDVDEEGGQAGQLPQQPLPQGHRRSSGGSATAADGAATCQGGSSGAGAAACKQQHVTVCHSASAAQQQAPPGQQQLQAQQPEWGALFTALSLGGGGGRSSQRADPIWAAASMNRGGCGGAGDGAGVRRPGATADAAPAASALGAPARPAAQPARLQPPANAPIASGGGASWRRNLSTSSGAPAAPSAFALAPAPTAATCNSESLTAFAGFAAVTQSDGAMEEDAAGTGCSRAAAVNTGAGAQTSAAVAANEPDAAAAAASGMDLDLDMAIADDRTTTAGSIAAAAAPTRPRGGFLMSEFNRLRAFGAGSPAVLG